MLKGSLAYSLRVFCHKNQAASSLVFFSQNGNTKRCKSTAAPQRKKESKKKKSSALKETVKTPRTEMPLSMKGVLEREAMVRQMFDHYSLYRWQENDESRSETFVLHDGPPYANGNPHIGHALNKIIKDITIRWKLLRGFKVNYIPGWDCHGLPIELKASQEAAESSQNLQRQSQTTNDDITLSSADENAISIRDCAKAFADKTIEIQKTAFQSWNIVADWKNGCYFSYDPKFEAAQLNLFYRMFEQGYVYQTFMPIYWSPSSQTALAESELEYNENHQSTSIYVKFPLVDAEELPLYALVWTTTPWTLPANRAIFFSPDLEYAKIRFEAEKDIYLVARDCIERLEDAFGKKVVREDTIAVKNLDRFTYSHPLSKFLPSSSPATSSLPFLPSKHVTTAKGSGLVHAAPAHGHEDFHALRACGLRVDEQPLVDRKGEFTEGAGVLLGGFKVLDDGNEKVLELLGDAIMKREDFVHSYPYDWRTKQPVITVASLQWFVSNKLLREKALNALENVRFFPNSDTAKSEMTQRVRQRDYWCISRQRVWGLPIPVFYDKETKQPLINGHTVEHIKNLFLNNGGSSVWWSLSMEELLPRQVLDASGLSEKSSRDFIRGDDILDIWFDSGSTWKTVVEAQTGDPKSDLYVEGIDQYGGWFLSSLLTCASMTDEAPFKDLLVHGFVVDEEGKKMSKSIGNVVDPQQVIFGDGGQIRGVGVDVLRYWVANSMERKNTVRLGLNVLSQNEEAVFKLRKSLRFLLGNLNDFIPSPHLVSADQMLTFDQAVMLLLNEFCLEITNDYDNYRYSSAMKRLNSFLEELSAIYLDPVRDRLYCDPANSIERHSAQSVLHNVLQVLLLSIAPVLPHLADEVNLYLQRDKVDLHFDTDKNNLISSELKQSVMKRSWSDSVLSTDNSIHSSNLKNVFKDCLIIRKYLFTQTKMSSDDLKEIDLSVEIGAIYGAESVPKLNDMRGILGELLGCSELSLNGVAESWSMEPLASVKRVYQKPVVVESDDEDMESAVGDTEEEVEILTPHLADGTEFRFLTQKTAKLRCLRCRLFRSESDGALCSRCQKIVAG